MVNQVHMKGYLVHLIWTMDPGSKGHWIISFSRHRTATEKHGGAMHELLGPIGSSPKKARLAYGEQKTTGSSKTES
jgi:hypothetical protein